MTAQTWTRRPLKTRNLSIAAKVAAWLAAAQIKPNHISLASIVAAAAAGACLLAGLPVFAAILIQLRLLCNLLDGMVAVEGGLRTATGELFNDLPDRLSDAIVLLAAGYSIHWPHGVELGWLATLIAVMTAYVRILGGACGLPQDFAGPMAKPQRMAVMTAACLLAPIDNRAIGIALITVIAGSLLTLASRLQRLVRNLEGNNQ